MIKVRKSDERGHANYGWLDTHHTFSFGNYHDPDHMNWRYLRVLNDDLISGGSEFPNHPHDNMEIFSYVTEGKLEHKDSLGNIAQVRPGRVQLMSAGSGITHSEYNPSKTERTHLFQVWIMPSIRNTEPTYQELDYDLEELNNSLKLLVAPESNEGAMTIRQKTRIYTGQLDTNKSINLPVDRYGWLQIIKGSITLNGHALSVGDGAGTKDENALKLTAQKDTEFLWFSMD
ncbi:pirin family protein [Rubellicoccus peritrichatus]|uniref:Pirin family protein n=1 Tax=Rubellicoccus peritrichatus TaxID=3080537 RepID=A0AAQ3L7X4_9BACT|nr:pirin family protein [Puniceicoccus sp. CR14]WOO41294.1 pirin family protein [Puniceicoccus sp. CR14]